MGDNEFTIQSTDQIQAPVVLEDAVVFGRILGETTPYEDNIDKLVEDLGRLPADEQRELLNRVLDRWSAGSGAHLDLEKELARAVSGASSGIRDIVAECLAVRAVTSPNAVTSHVHAIAAVEAASGRLNGTPSASDEDRLRRTLESLERLVGPEGAARFVQALNPAMSDASDVTAQERVRRTLERLEGLVGPEGAARFVQALNPAMSGASSRDVAAQERVLAAMNSGAPTATGDIVMTALSQLAALEGQPGFPEAMANVLAQAGALLFGADARTLDGPNLESAVSRAMSLPFGARPPDEAVQVVVSEIVNVGGGEAPMAVLPVVVGIGDHDPLVLPLFRVLTASGDRYVDVYGRSHADLNAWKDQLPPGAVVIIPMNAGQGGNLQFASLNAEPPWRTSRAYTMAAAGLLSLAIADRGSMETPLSAGGIIGGGRRVGSHGAQLWEWDRSPDLQSTPYLQAIGGLVPPSLVLAAGAAAAGVMPSGIPGLTTARGEIRDKAADRRAVSGDVTASYPIETRVVFDGSATDLAKQTDLLEAFLRRTFQV
jgi:hypothetical protein